MLARSPISVDRSHCGSSPPNKQRPGSWQGASESLLKAGLREPIVPKREDVIASKVRSRVKYTEPFAGFRKSLMPVQQWADPPFVGPIAISLAGHSCLLLAFLMHFHPKMQGSKVNQIQQESAMEVVFQPPSHNEMSGPSSPVAGGGVALPTVSKPKKPKKKHAEAALTVPEDQSSEGEIEIGKEADKKQETKNSTHEPERKPERQKETAKTKPSDKDNPFAHPTDINFPNNQPSPSPKAGRRGGNNRAVNLSTGPLSLNGQINAPYKSTTSVKGVSSEYGEEIDRWIREHLYYPDDAIQNDEEGPTSVHVVLDRQGRVSRVVLSSQSGSYSLDSATVAMFEHAQLPPVPPDMKGSHFDIDVTVNYILLR